MSGLVRPASSIPQSATSADGVHRPPLRGGEAEPTRLHAIKDPELRAVFMAAHRGWALRYRPHLLKEWQ